MKNQKGRKPEFWETLDLPIRFRHLRSVGEGEFSPYGGATQAYYYDGAEKRLVVAHSFCSDRDHYCKRLGRNHAAGRLMSAQHRRIYSVESPADDRNEEVFRLLDADLATQQREWDKRRGLSE